MSKETYYEEGDKCPCCGGMIEQRQESDTGYNYLICQDCNVDFTEVEKD